MGTLISLDSICHKAGSKDLFNNLKLVIEDNSRLGIIGPNGSGKSTLMKIIAETLEPDAGRVVRASNVQIAYVPQLDDFKPETTIHESMLEKLHIRFDEHESQIRAAKFLNRVGFQDTHKKVSELSGGWRKRLTLAAALAFEPDLLLLDEPTNHLDLAGLLWLEDLLVNADFAWALISHDRYFLERTVNSVLEINSCFRDGLLKLNGTYNVFLEKRDALIEQEARSTESLANKVRNELAWAARGPQGRTTKANFRMQQAQSLNAELQERKSRMRSETSSDVAFTSSNRQTKELVELIKVSLDFHGRQIIKQESFTLTAGACLGVLGDNGQGKSTLLKLIGGTLEPNGGKIKRANFLKTVYFDQLRASLHPTALLREALADRNDQVIYQGRGIHISSWSKRFGFHPEDLHKTVASLSGGEQARLLLSILVRQEADLLILDEPTNDLDISMLETLEEMLIEFNGAVVLVTHDRYMLERVCTSFLGFTANQHLLPFASYAQWEQLRRQEQVSKTESKSVETSIKKKLTAEELREYGQMERKIIKAEKKLEEIMKKAGEAAAHSSYQESQKISAELKEAQVLVDTLYLRWSELEALQNQ